MNIKCIIVDDEYLAVRVLKEYALKTEALTVVETFTDSQKALQFLQTNNIDLLLLDIQMPYLNGFELLKQLEQPPLVIFTTARHDFAVKAYELDVLDYLVKPMSFDRFQKAINKATEYLQLREMKSQQKPEEKKHLIIKADYRILKLQIEDILYIEGLNEYVKIHTTEKAHITLAALKELEKNLPHDQFIRIHKSYIIAFSTISEFTSNSVKLKNGKEFSIGRSYKNNFISRMKK